MRIARRADLHAIRLVGAVGNKIDAEFPFRRFDHSVSLARGHVHAFGEEFEVVDQFFHILLHRDARRRRDLVAVAHHRAGIIAQPLDALLDDAVGLAHLFDTHEVTVIAIAVDADRNVELHAVVNFVRLLLAQVPLDARAAQHGAGKAQRFRTLRRHHADADGTLLPDAVIGQQSFVLVDISREAPREILDEIQQRTLPVGVEIAHRGGVMNAGSFVLRHRVRQIAVHAARPIVRGVHARARYRLIAIHQVFALAEAIEEDGHRAYVERMRAQPQTMVKHTRDLVEHDADVLRAQRHVDADQLLDRHHVRMFVAHHGHVVETVHVWHRLNERAVLREFFGRAVQQPDMRVGAFDYFAVELQHEAQHAMSSRMLRPEVHGVVANFSHEFRTSTRRYRGPQQAASAACCNADSLACGKLCRS